MILTAIILSIISILYIFSVIKSSFNESYWKKRGVKYVGSKNVFATFWAYFTGDRGLYAIFGDVYSQYPDEPAVAMASVFTPILFVKHPKNVQHVLAENFQAFHHRGFNVNKNDKLSDNVLFMNGNRWKLTRQKMTPLFTSAKLKNMFYIMDKSARDFVEYINENIDKKNNAFDDLSLFCCAAIGSAVFGVRGRSTFESPFLQMAKTATKPTLQVNIKFAINSLAPSLFRFLKLKQFGDYEKAFIKAMKQVFREREQDDTKKYDFPEMAVNLLKNGKMRDESTGYELEPTDELMAAQGFFFLIAGVEPTAMGIFGTLFELAKRPDIQRRVQDEIDRAFDDNNSNVNFDVISGLEYLDKVLEEALRMHPPISYLSRRCMEDSVLPVGNIKVSKGTQILTPILAIHHDPKYYPDPDVFDPERFTSEKKRERPNMTFMPFGEGGRLCIGQRYAYLQMKTGLVHILRNFNVLVDDLNQKMTYLKTPLIVRPTSNINFYYELRK